MKLAYKHTDKVELGRPVELAVSQDNELTVRHSSGAEIRFDAQETRRIANIIKMAKENNS